MLVEIDSCKEDVAIILFPTSRKTMEGSSRNFGNHNVKDFTQYKIEEYIKNKDLKCMIRKKIDYGDKEIIFLRSRETIHKSQNE